MIRKENNQWKMIFPYKILGYVTTNIPKYIVAQITGSYPQLFLSTCTQTLLPKASTNMRRKLRSAFQIANSEPTSANLPSFPPCHDLRSKLPCAIHILKVLEVTWFVICQKSSPFPTLFVHFDTLFLLLIINQTTQFSCCMSYKVCYNQVTR